MGNYKVKYARNTKQITLLRNIVAALVYESSGAHEDQIKVLFDLLPQMLEKAQKDAQFFNKHNKYLINLYDEIKNMNIQAFPFKPSVEIVIRLQSDLRGWLPSASAYFGWSRNPTREKSYLVIPTGLHLRLPKKIPPKKFIGVGYKDKGKLRNLSEDASPSWQDVAKDSAYLDRLREEDPEEYEFLVKTVQRHKKREREIEKPKLVSPFRN